MAQSVAQEQNVIFSVKLYSYEKPGTPKIWMGCPLPYDQSLPYHELLTCQKPQKCGTRLFQDKPFILLNMSVEWM